MRVRLIKPDLVQVGDGVHQGQPRGVLPDRGRERAQQRCSGARLPVEGEAEGVIGEQTGCLGPLACRLQVADPVRNVPVLSKPVRGEPVQLRDLPGHGPAQLDAQEFAEHAVVAEPSTTSIEGHDERVGVLEVQQDPFRPGAAAEQVSQLTVDPVQ